MWSVELAPGFAPFRAAARELLAYRVHPRDVVFTPPGAPSLFARWSPTDEKRWPVDVPRALGEQLRLAAMHADPDAPALLYRLLWRQVRGDVPLGGLLADKASPDVARMQALVAAVHKDVHAMHAFVRFRERRAADSTAYGAVAAEGDDGARWLAFHRPDHWVVQEAAPHFARRYSDMRWAILTPRGSAWHDERTRTLSFGPPVTRADDVTEADALDALWTTYYASVFNPARVSPKTTRMHLPARHHATLPEAAAIPALVRDARSRTLAMVETPQTSGARPFLPKDRGLVSLAHAASTCSGCELAGHATQTVFGEGPHDARLVFVGEQPGDQEDRAGRPFVGPAGQVLDRALAEAGLDRARVYLTNTVKHFRFRLDPAVRDDDGKPRRLHDRPRASDVRACRPWLEAELVRLRPLVLVCLGSTAARALVHPRLEVTTHRGHVGRTAWAPHTVVTYHPSAVLRDEDGPAIERALVADLRLAAGLARS